MTTPNRDEAGDPPRRTPRRSRGEPKLYISFLPEGRGGPREDKGSVPLEVDVEAHIEERTDCEPGLYRIEKKRSGEFSGEVLFYSKDEAEPESEHDAAAIGLFAEPAERLGTESSEAEIRRIVAATVSATLEARERRTAGSQPDPMQQFREMRELLKEERDSGSPSQQDPIAMFERLVELQKKLTPERPDPVDSLSAKDRAQLMLVKETGIIPEFMRSMREMLRAPEVSAEPKSLIEKALDYAAGWTPYVGPVLAPVLGQKVSELLSRMNLDVIAQRMNGQAGETPPPQTPNPNPSSSESEFARSIEASLLEALDVVVECMTLDTDDSDGEEHCERAASALQTFVKNNPVVAPQILQGLLSESSASLVAQLAASKPEWAYVAKLGHAPDFIDRLKETLSSAEETDAETGDVSESVADVDAVPPNPNGAKAAEVVGH